MPDIFNFTPEMETYFSTLPVYVQENIKQSNQKINSLEDLRAVSEKLMERKQAEMEECFLHFFNAKEENRNAEV